MSFEYNNETWRTEGSEYIGLDVSFGSWSGKIIGWLPPDSAGLNRYLVKYTDGVKEERDWLSEVDDWLTEESKEEYGKDRMVYFPLLFIAKVETLSKIPLHSAIDYNKFELKIDIFDCNLTSGTLLENGC